jgi:ACS family glucarate transporter-like MFS transporter
VKSLTTAEQEQAIAAGVQKATRTRYWVVAFAVALAMVQYIDRICISQAKANIAKDLLLDAKQMGWVFGAFTLGYALFEIPGGWLGDKYGPRKTLMRIVCWWSFFTAATGWVGGFVSLLSVRFLFGAGEAGYFPNIARAFVTWLLPDERVRAQSILWLGARWAGAFTPVLVVKFLELVTWRQAFEMFGALGAVWAFIFYWWYRDDPNNHPGVNAAERELLSKNSAYASGHGNVPWSLMISSPWTWLIWAQYFFLSYVWYFYVTWLPTFLKESYGAPPPEATGAVNHVILSPTELGLLAGVPLFFGGFGSLISGFLERGLTRVAGNLKLARRIQGCVSFIGAGIALVVAANVSSPVAVMLSLGMASFFGDLTLPCSWGVCMDVGGRYSGTYSGSMNMMGNLGGVVAPIVTGYVVGDTKNWTPIFYISAFACVLASMCWALLNPKRSLDEGETAAAH